MPSILRRTGKRKESHLTECKDPFSHHQIEIELAIYSFDCNKYTACTSLQSFNWQSRGDFPIFFVTSLINLYQSTLLIHELLLDHKGTITINFQKKKQAKISF